METDLNGRFMHWNGIDYVYIKFYAYSFIQKIVNWIAEEFERKKKIPRVKVLTNITLDIISKTTKHILWHNFLGYSQKKNK